jgi:hypothetical protein
MLDVLGRVVMAITTDAGGTAPVTYLPYPVACTSCALASKQCASPESETTPHRRTLYQKRRGQKSAAYLLHTGMQPFIIF